MPAMTNDPSRSLSTGLAFAIPSAVAFGLSGSLARSLMEAGWTAGAATLVRVLIATSALLVPGALAMRGQWHLLRASALTLLAYGVFAVAGAQLCYFMAVSHLPIGVALLIEYTAPVAVVLWMWASHGHRPGALTAVGAVLAAAGLILLLDVLGGGDLSLVGVGWALAAMVGAAMYFVISGDESHGLPPLALAAGGLLVAGVALGVAAVIGVLPVHVTTMPGQFVGLTLPWWTTVLLLGLLTAAFAYVTGIAGARRLGPRLASFVALTEVLAALTFAWLLLGEAPLPIQLAGAALVLAGVIVVKLGEGRVPGGRADVADLRESHDGTFAPVPVEP